jgi:hypothetical protein
VTICGSKRNSIGSAGSTVIRTQCHVQKFPLLWLGVGSITHEAELKGGRLLRGGEDRQGHCEECRQNEPSPAASCCHFVLPRPDAYGHHFQVFTER